MSNKSGLTVAVLLTLFSTQGFASPNQCSATNFSVCLNGVGPAVTNNDNLRTSSYRVTNDTRKRNTGANKLNSALTPNGLSGLAAGDGYAGWSIWGSYNRSGFDADMPINAANPVASYDADQDSFFVGADTLLNNRWILGLAVGYSNTDIFTVYNGGNNETDGVTVTPYAAYLINDVFSVDVAGGYTSLDYDTDRIDVGSGGTIFGEFDADRWFVAANVNAVVSTGNWYLAGRLGYLHTEEEQDGYTETGPAVRTVGERDIDLSQFIAGVDVAYSFGWLEPYATFTYLNDISKEDGAAAGGLPGGVGTTVDDDDEVQAGFGFRYYGSGVSGTLEWTSTVGRDTFSGDVLMLTFRADL